MPAARPAVRRAGVVRVGVVRVGALALLVPGLGLSLLGTPAAAEVPAVLPSVPGAATTTPGGTADVDAAAPAVDGVSWELVGAPDASLVRSASVDAATGAVAVEVTPGYRGRVVLQRRAVDRSGGFAGVPAPVVVEVAGDEVLEPGERLRMPLDTAGGASVDVPLPAPADGGAYVVEAGPGLDVEVEVGDGVDGGATLHVAAEDGVAGAGSVVLVPTAEDGVRGEPLEVAVDVAPSLAPLVAEGRADEPLEVALPDVVGGAGGRLEVQAPDGGPSASAEDDGLRLDPRGSSGLLALAIVPSAGGVVGDPAPVTADVAPVVAPVDVEAAAGEEVRVPLETTGTDVRTELVDDADGALVLDGDELVVSVPEGTSGPLGGRVRVTDADGLRSGAAAVLVSVPAAEEPPAEEPPAEEPAAEEPAAEEPAAEEPADDHDGRTDPVGGPTASDPSERPLVRLGGAVLPPSPSGAGDAPGAGDSLTQEAANRPTARPASGQPSGSGSGAFGSVSGLSSSAPTAEQTTEGGTGTTAPTGAQAAPGLVVLETFSTAPPTAATTPTTPVATTTGTTVTALPRTGGELVVGGLLGLLVAAGGATLLVVSRRVARTA